jgi:KUP system potassium uptake protein
MITPAISVLSAIEGVQIATPALKPYVVPVAAGVLIALFAIQSRGSGRMGRLFGADHCGVVCGAGDCWDRTSRR